MAFPGNVEMAFPGNAEMAFPGNVEMALLANEIALQGSTNNSQEPDNESQFWRSPVPKTTDNPNKMVSEDLVKQLYVHICLTINLITHLITPKIGGHTLFYLSGERVDSMQEVFQQCSQDSQTRISRFSLIG